MPSFNLFGPAVSEIIMFKGDVSILEVFFCDFSDSSESSSESLLCRFSTTLEVSVQANSGTLVAMATLSAVKNFAKFRI